MLAFQCLAGRHFRLSRQSANIITTAEETRRSGRATKGQHKKLEDEPEPTPKPKSKKGGKPKASKKNAEPTPSDDAGDDDEGGDEVIRCVCGHNEDDIAGKKFIACDACEVWQHNDCMGVPLKEEDQPEHYFCEQCRPEDHEELVAAIERGEPIWLERQKAAKGGKRKSKGGRQSRVSNIKPDDAAVSSSPAPPTKEAGNKRKFEEEVPEVGLPYRVVRSARSTCLQCQ